MNKEERIKEIRKAVKLLGWMEVGARVRSREDQAIFAELGEEFRATQKANDDKILEKHNIKF